MRRLQTWLVAAGLALSPAVAADPRQPSKRPDTTSETFEWSTVRSNVRLGVMVIGLTPELRTHYGASQDRGVVTVLRDRKPLTLTATVQQRGATSMSDMPFPRWFDDFFRSFREPDRPGARSTESTRT